MVTTWQDGHFVGGHPVLDLTNTVFSRAEPLMDNDLLTSPADVLSWCMSAGLFDRAPRLADERTLIDDVREIREHAWAVFDAVARGADVSPEHLGYLLQRAGEGLRAGDVRSIDARLAEMSAKWSAPGSIPTVLAAMAVHAFFTLPADRIRACDRCGWLFLDSSRGGRRRWCSMSTCGNREKASRHRSTVS
jgi:predicted RNA-binding Zn ribbon-like protein